MGLHPNAVRYQARLADPEVRRWHDNLARGSPTTASHYLRSLYAFSESSGLSIPKIARLSEVQAHRTILDFVAREEKRGLAGSSIQMYVKAVRSWLAYHGKKVDRPVRIRDSQQTPTLRNERVPTQEELRRILLASTHQERVAIALVAHTGVRLEVLGNFHGTDGLRVADFPELRMKGSTVEFAEIPTLVVVRPELSKTKRQYFSFLGAEGCEYLKTYLEDRIAHDPRLGGKLKPESDILAPVHARKQFVKTTNVSDMMRRAIDRGGFDARPYVLRAFFDSQLLLAESRGKLAHDYRVFWMGHRGSIDARYTTNKGRLPKDMVEDMRAAYRECEPFLSGVPQRGENRTDVLRVVLAELLRERGASEEQVESALSGKTPPDQVGELVRRLTRPAPERVVLRGEEAQARLVSGWNPVATFPDGTVVLEGPAGRPTAGVPSSGPPAARAGSLP